MIPQWSYLKELKMKKAEFKKKQKEQFDSRHGAKELPEIPDDSAVWITSEDKPIPGRIVTVCWWNPEDHMLKLNQENSAETGVRLL